VILFTISTAYDLVCSKNNLVTQSGKEEFKILEKRGGSER